ncbi:hypothetical protein ACFE04_027457 [Oxalis oulophora]
MLGDRLVRLLSLSVSNSVPLRAFFKVWRKLGLPDDFEDYVIGKNPNIFYLGNGNEPNTHVLKLVDEKMGTSGFTVWRVTECCKEDCDIDRKTAQALEKRAVAVCLEFLSLAVEKMVEVEKVSHFRNVLGIDFNIRDLFIDHPGIFYVSTKGNRGMLKESSKSGNADQTENSESDSQTFSTYLIISVLMCDAQLFSSHSALDIGQASELKAAIDFTQRRIYVGR